MAPPPAHTTGNLLYIIEPEGGLPAYQHVNANPITGERERNFQREEKSVVIENLRGKEDAVSLDTAGFQFYHCPSKHILHSPMMKRSGRNIIPRAPSSLTKQRERAGWNCSTIVRFYVPTFIKILFIILLHSAIRRRCPGEADDSAEHRQPVSQVHVDQTTASAIARVHRHLPASEVPKLLERRFQIINLWRPIATPAVDWPLTLCDYRSINLKQEVIPVKLIFPDREGETLGVKYNENHKWKYLQGMTLEEFVLIKW